MSDVLEILGEAILIATFQPRRAQPVALGPGDSAMDGPRRFRPERAGDRKRT